MLSYAFNEFVVIRKWWFNETRVCVTVTESPVRFNYPDSGWLFSRRHHEGQVWQSIISGSQSHSGWCRHHHQCCILNAGAFILRTKVFKEKQCEAFCLDASVLLLDSASWSTFVRYHSVSVHFCNVPLPSATVAFYPALSWYHRSYHSWLSK